MPTYVSSCLGLSVPLLAGIFFGLESDSGVREARGSASPVITSLRAVCWGAGLGQEKAGATNTCNEVSPARSKVSLLDVVAECVCVGACLSHILSPRRPHLIHDLC